jgi:hypothetical protein
MTLPPIPGDDFTLHARVGQLVWAAQKGYPPWPAMMTYHPEAGVFCKATSRNGLSRTYHVQFFGAKATRAWVHRNMLSAYDDLEGKSMLEVGPKKKTVSARLAQDLILVGI